MSQNTVVLPTTGTVSGLQMTQGTNNALDTLNSLWSGATAPSSPEAGQWWHDTANNILKIRSLDNTAWIAVTALNETAYTASPVYSTQSTGSLNRIINGGMIIDQIDEGGNYTIPTGGTPIYTLDQWVASCSSSSASSIFCQRIADAPAGFSNSLRFNIGTGASSIGSTDFLYIYQPIEANNLSDFNYGTVNAVTSSLSFWVKSSVSGNYAAVLQNGAGNRNIVYKFTITASSTWQQIVLPNVPGDQTGTWSTGNSAMLNVFVCIAAGTGLQTSTTGVWQNGAYIASNTQTNTLLSTTGATFQITGVMLNPGVFCLPYEKKMFAAELQACSRYFEKSYDQGVSPGTNTSTNAEAVVASNSTVQFNVRFKVPKRTAPTLVAYSSSSGTSANMRNVSAGSDLSASTAYIGTNGCTIYSNSATSGSQYIVQWTSNARM